MSKQMKLQELGENIASAEVVAILVGVGDVIHKDQPVMELETDKATAELPATLAGTVRQIHIKEGDQVAVGQILLTVDDRGLSTPAPPPAGASESSAAPPAATPPPEPDRTPQVSPAARVRRVPNRQTPAARPVSAVPKIPVAASPSVRRLARELGVEVELVPGGGKAGRITEEDIKTYVRTALKTPVPGSGAAGRADPPPLPDLTPWGEVERQPLSGLRKATSAAMSTSWSTIPHVTQFDRADITSLDAFRRQQKETGLTLTSIMVNLSARMLAAFPHFNACLDTATQELVIRKYINIGVAVDTERGLLVPVIRNVESKGLHQVATELAQLALRARSRKSTRDDLSGAGFTLTNLGGLGTTHFSPLVNWPQVAILGLGRARLEPVHLNGAFQPRLIMPLSLSYDHRIIDGADAARFLRRLAETVENPWLALPGV